MDTHKLRELLDRRDTLDAEIADVVNNGVRVIAKARAPQKCGVCGSEGHSARTCPQKQVVQ